MLRLEWETSECWRVTLERPGVTAGAKMNSFVPDAERTLALFFSRIADDWMGWDGGRE